jgi:uncharacterized membrane protein HdeD (DUF308 family)
MEPEPVSPMEVLRGSRILAFTVGVITIIAGVVLLAWPDRTIVVVARVAGLLVAVIGVAEIIEALTSRTRGSYWGLLLARGVLNLVMGVLLLVWPDITVTALVWLFGLDLIITGIIGLAVSGRVAPEHGRSSFIVRGIVGIVLGILIVAWPDVTLWVITVIVALQLLIVGAVLLWSGYALGRLEKQGPTTLA